MCMQTGIKFRRLPSVQAGLSTHLKEGDRLVGARAGAGTTMPRTVSQGKAANQAQSLSNLESLP
jgi:hypothetical protein